MFSRLEPPLPVFILDKGPGYACGLIDYGPEHHLLWVTALDAGGEIWSAPNPQVRLQENWSLGRKRESGAVPSTLPTAETLRVERG